jgi:hypothetical protein
MLLVNYLEEVLFINSFEDPYKDRKIEHNEKKFPNAEELFYLDLFYHSFLTEIVL